MVPTQEQAERYPLCLLALAELRQALASAGVNLPGLKLDPTSFQDADGVPLFSLGLCNMGQAERLIEVLRKGSE